MAHSSNVILDVSSRIGEITSNAEILLDAGRIDEAQEYISEFEKEARLGKDFDSVSIIATWLLNKYFSTENIDKAIAWLSQVFYKRGQAQSVHIIITEKAYEHLLTESKDIKLKLIKCLLKLTTSKMYLEIQRARIMQEFAHIKESEGEIETAANLLQEVQIETNVHVDKFERADYLLEQLRLLLLKGDFIRLNMVCKKFSLKALMSEGFETVKLIFCYYMIRYFDHENDLINIYENLMICANTDFTKVDIDRIMKIFPDNITEELKSVDYMELNLHMKGFFIKYAAMSLSLADYCSLKVHKIKLLLLKNHRELSNDMTLLRICEILSSDEILSAKSELASSIGSDNFIQNEFPISNSQRKLRLIEKAFVDHSLVIMSRFYSQATIKSFSNLIGVSVEDTEKSLCQLIKKNYLQAKINRLTQTVKFIHLEESDPLADWANGISNTLDMLKECCSLIEKENLVPS